MLDTIGLNLPIRIDPAQLVYWDEDVYRKAKGGRFIRYKYMATSDRGALVTYTYYPYANQGTPILNIEFSLPHLVLGSNVYQVFNIKEAIDLANGMLPDVPGVPKLDLWDGVLTRLDVCYNHQVGDLVPHYIRALIFHDYPNREPRPYMSSGVQFPTKNATFKLYDKQKERLKNRDHVGAQLAYGILRQETTNRKGAVRKLTGLKQPTLRDINIDMLLDALENELKKLDLLNRPIGTRKIALEQLCAKYGSRAGVYYFGLLAAKGEQPSKDVIASNTGLHPRSLDRQLEKIVQADIPLTLTDTEEPLPPLTIDRAMVMRMASEDVLVSENTR